MVSRARPVSDSPSAGRADSPDELPLTDSPSQLAAIDPPARPRARKPAVNARSPQKKQLGSAPSANEPIDVPPTEGKRHEVLGLLTLSVGVLSALALASYDTRGGRDWAGPAGVVVAEGLIAVLGTASVVVPVALLVQSVHFFRRTVQPVRPLRVLGTVAIVITIATALHLAMGERPLLGHLAAGGLVGVSLGETLRAILGTAGAHLVVLTALLVALVVRTRLSVVAFARSAGRAGAKTGHLAKEGVVTVARAWQKARTEDDPREDIANSARLLSPEARVEVALSSVLETQRDSFDGDESEESDAGRSDGSSLAQLVAMEQKSTPPANLLVESPVSDDSLFDLPPAPLAPIALDEPMLEPVVHAGGEGSALSRKRPLKKKPSDEALAPVAAVAAVPSAAVAIAPAPALASLPPIVIHQPHVVAAPIELPLEDTSDARDAFDASDAGEVLAAPEPLVIDPVRNALAESAALLDMPSAAAVAAVAPSVPSSPVSPSDAGPARRKVRRAPRTVVVEGAPLPPMAVAPPVAAAHVAPPVAVARVAPAPTPARRPPLPMPAARASEPEIEREIEPQPTPPATQVKSVPPPRMPVAAAPERESIEPLPIVSHDEEIAAALEAPPAHIAAAPRVPVPIHYEFPPSSLLAPAPKDGITIDETALRAQADRLVKTLKDYQIEGEIAEIHPGPVVTTFEFVPTAGTKLARIAARSDDIAMSLAVNKVRIVAPIPGKGRVGFEIPNPSRKTVFFRELVETEAFDKLGGALPVALGKDVVGAPFFSDLAKMPHLIVAGATGQGKSVGLNVMLCSMLYKRGPEEVRMLMIDPKMVELAVYDGIPHMLLPVVTDMKKASIALRWVVDEMERRYSLFAQTGSRNIISYNERVAKSLNDGVPMKGFSGPVRTKQNGTTTDVSKNPDAQPDTAAPEPTALPYIVVVVDEFADLMMVAGKEVEAAVARLAQKARAAGIHVILATQRPSVDVITGMIKANFPSRVGFKVTSKVDSRTILDQQGAENLLGMGDMLILPPGSSDLRRVHCAFVSEDEVQAITDHWRKQGTPTYDEEILRPRDEDEENAGEEPEIKVPMEKYEKAIALVLSSRRCSVSWIQRQLAIGYNVAARIVERMEREGIVSPPKGPGKDREVLG